MEHSDWALGESRSRCLAAPALAIPGAGEGAGKEQEQGKEWGRRVLNMWSSPLATVVAQRGRWEGGGGRGSDRDPHHAT